MRSELVRMLGGPVLVDGGGSASSDEDVPFIRLDLRPGDVLYAQGSESVYAYIVKSGLMMCQRRGVAGGNGVASVNFASTHDWLGVHDPRGLRGETATAVTSTTLLALTVQELRQMEGKSPVIAELIARPIGQALMRDWRTLYRLRDLPAYTRTVAGLAHLADLAVRSGDDQAPPEELATHLEVETLGRWLDLGTDELEKSLAQLHRYGALSLHGRHIEKLMPEVLISISSASRKTALGWKKASAGVWPIAGGALLSSSAAQAATLAVSQPLCQPVPWGFVVFCAVVFSVIHLLRAGR
ncbi:MAG: Crp/Fnr family transcriptional regulator [Acidobacteriota bacterium]